MNYKEQLLVKLRAATTTAYDMPAAPVQGITYADPLAQFVEMSHTVGSQVIMAAPGDTLDALVRRAYPEARVIASNLSQLTIATLNPDTVGTIGVIGPNANSRVALIGNYHGTASRYTTVLEGIQEETEKKRGPRRLIKKKEKEA